MKISVVGLIGSITYQKGKYCAQDLHDRFPKQFEQPDIKGYLEFEWKEFINAKIKEIRGELWAFDEDCIVFLDGQHLGGSETFIQWAIDNHNHEDFRPMTLYITLAEDGYKDELSRRNHPFVFMDISVGKEDIGRIVIELYHDLVPKTCDNFLAFCTGENGTSKHNEVEQFDLHYKNTIFHRIVPRGWVQGGDIWYGKGNGGESIYGPTFEDENFAVPHDRRGVVSMANRGRHTNGSQFFFTFNPAPWMDTKFVAFGQIVEGTSVLDKLEMEKTVNDRPIHEVKIADCGRYVP